MLSQISAVIVTMILIGLTCFQILLILGLPLGKYAWGGFYEVLPQNFKIGSLFAIIIYAFIDAVVLSRARLISLNLSSINGETIWLVVGYFLIAVFANLNSKSIDEKRVMTPIAIALCILCLIVGIGI
jgi:hypothetical protein